MDVADGMTFGIIGLLALAFTMIMYGGYTDAAHAHEICEGAGLTYVGRCGPMAPCPNPIPCLNESSHRIEYYRLR